MNRTRGIVVADTVEIAGTWLKRLQGLLFKDRLPEKHCLILNPCNSVHTCFMRFNIDVLFIGNAGEVVYLLENMPSFRFSPIIRKARFVLELPAHTISSTGTSLGDRMSFFGIFAGNSSRYVEYGK